MYEFVALDKILKFVHKLTLSKTLLGSKFNNNVECFFNTL